MVKKTVKKASKTAKKVTKAPAKKATKAPAKSAKKSPAKKKAPAARAKTQQPVEKTQKKKVKCPLTTSELRAVRSLLLEKRRAILGDMSAMEAEALGTGHGASGDLSNMPTHLADIGTDNYEQEFTLGLLESERAVLSEIDEALERINEKTYGICLGTGEPIGKPRLMARPWAKYTIEYARLIEQGMARPVDKNGRDRPAEGADDQDGDDSD